MAKDLAPAPPFRLTRQEIDSSAWIRLSGHLTEAVDSLRTKLERDLPEAETASVRGQIKMARKILELATEDRPPLAWVDANAPPERRPMTREEQLDKYIKA